MTSVPTRLCLLGPIRASVGDTELALGAPKQRAVLAMLASRAGEVVGTAALVVGLWGDDPPDQALATVQVYVSGLRKALAGSQGITIRTQAPGYALELSPPASLDLVDFESAARVPAAAPAIERFEGYGAALALRRGTFCADLADHPFHAALAAWFDERCWALREQYVDAGLELGRNADMIAELETMVAETPLRERHWAQLMVALYRSGRQADALAAYQRCRRTLVDALGIEPGPELRRLETAVLEQDDDHLALRPGGDDRPGETTTMQVMCGDAELVAEDGTSVVLSGIVVLGRSVEATVQIDDVAVSRRHAEIRPSFAGWLLRDLGSTNGTTVNGQPVSHVLLSDGDVVEIGAHRFTVRVELPPGATDAGR